MIRNLCIVGLGIGMLISWASSPALSWPDKVRTQHVHGETIHRKTDLRYTLGPFDVLEIMLYNRPELKREVKLSRQGTFAYPLLGQVRARGLTVAELEQSLTVRLKRIHIPNPQVVVTVKAYHNRHIFLLGQVQYPGVYSLPGHVQLKDLILQAQGLTPEAEDFLIVIRGERPTWPGRVAPVNHMRNVPGTRVDLKMLMTGQVTPAVKLRSGDTIYVPRRLTGYAWSCSGCAAAEPHRPVYTAAQIR